MEYVYTVHNKTTLIKCGDIESNLGPRPTLLLNHRQAGMSEWTSYGKNYCPDVRPHPRLPRGWVFTVRGCGKNRVHANASLRSRGCGASARVPASAGRRGPVSARMRIDTHRVDIGPHGCG
jgi:hypothetical protein